MQDNGATLALLGPWSNYRGIYVAGVLFFYLWEQYLSLRKGWALQAETVPVELAAHIDAETCSKTRKYNKAKNQFGYVSDFIGTAQSLVMLHFAPRLWTFSADTVANFGLDASNQYFHAAVFVIVGSVVEYPIGLLIKIYSTFVIEEHFGFNKHTWKSFLGDEVKSFVVMNVLLSGLMYMPMIWIVGLAGPDAWFWLWVFLSIFVLIFNVAYPVVIAPLFNSFTPLEDAPPAKKKTGVNNEEDREEETEGAKNEGEDKNETAPKNEKDQTRKTVDGLKEGIFSLVEKTGLSCKAVFEVDGSRQSSHSNAYVAGMCGSKRIVIYDTLIKDIMEEMNDIKGIQAVVGHEIGHSIMHHTWALLAITQMNFGLMFWTFGYVQSSPTLVSDFGYSLTDQGTAAHFLVIQCFMAVYSQLVMPFWGIGMNAFTRRLEFSADRYSQKLGFDLGPPLIAISKKNLGDLNPDWLVSMCHDNHPTLLERIRALDKKGK